MTLPVAQVLCLGSQCRCCLTKKTMPSSLARNCRNSMSCQGITAASALIEPECCSCLTQVSEGSSDNSWVFDLIRRSPLFAGIPLATLLYLRSVVSVGNSHPSYWRWFAAILYQCDIGSEDWHWFSIQESSTLYIKVAISCLYSSCYFKSSYQFLESQHFF